MLRFVNWSKTTNKPGCVEPRRYIVSKEVKNENSTAEFALSYPGLGKPLIGPWNKN